MSEPGQNRPLRVGVVGAGRMGRRHGHIMRQWPQRFEVAGVCDRYEPAAQELAHELDLPPRRAFADLEAMLDAPGEGPGAGDGRRLDAVVVCTVHDEHARDVIAAAQRGLHVLVEKPMATNMADCRAMVAAAEEAGVVLMVGQNQRYKANYRAVKRLIDSGELGAIRAARVESNGGGKRGGESRTWVRDARRAGGGVVISLATHRIDLMRWFVGEPSRVMAVCRSTQPRFLHGAEDFAVAIVEFDHGAVGEVFASIAPHASPWGESFVIFGDRGTVHAHPLAVRYNEPALVASAARCPQSEASQRNAPGAAQVLTPACGEAGGGQRGERGPDGVNGDGGEAGGRRRRRDFVPLEVDVDGLPSNDMFVNELLHFADCCRTGAEPLSSGRDNLGTMRVVFGIYESARRGAAVELAEL